MDEERNKFSFQDLFFVFKPWSPYKTKTKMNVLSVLKNIGLFEDFQASLFVILSRALL